MIINTNIFIFIFFAIITEIINYLFQNNTLSPHSDSNNEPKFVVIINNVEMSVYPFFKLNITENTSSINLQYQSFTVVYNKVNETVENKAYLKYNNNYYLPEDHNLLIYSPYLQLNNILNSINICGINELFIYINSFNDHEGTSSSTNEGTSSSTNEGTSSSTNEGTSSSTNEGTSSSTNEGTSSSTNEGTSTSTNEGTSSSTNEGTSSSVND